MSRVFSWEQAVRDSDLDTHTKTVLFVMRTYMDSNGVGYPSLDLLMKGASMARMTVVKRLNIAMNAGFIGKRKHGFGGQKWARNEYYACFPKDNKLVHQDEEKGGSPGEPPLGEGSSRENKKAVHGVNSNIPIEQTKGKGARERDLSSPLFIEICKKREKGGTLTAAEENFVRRYEAAAMAVAGVEAEPEEKPKPETAAPAAPAPTGKPVASPGSAMIPFVEKRRKAEKLRDAYLQQFKQGTIYQQAVKDGNELAVLDFVREAAWVQAQALAKLGRIDCDSKKLLTPEQLQEPPGLKRFNRHILPAISRAEKLGHIEVAVPSWVMGEK